MTLPPIKGLNIYMIKACQETSTFIDPLWLLKVIEIGKSNVDSKWFIVDFTFFKSLYNKSCSKYFFVRLRFKSRYIWQVEWSFGSMDVVELNPNYLYNSHIKMIYRYIYSMEKSSILFLAFSYMYLPFRSTYFSFYKSTRNFYDVQN